MALFLSTPKLRFDSPLFSTISIYMGSTCLRIKCLFKRAWLLLGFFFVLGASVNGQDKALADSLELIYNSGSYLAKNRLKILEDLAANHPNPEKALKLGTFYSDKSLENVKCPDSDIKVDVQPIEV